VPLAQQVRSGRALQGNPSLPILFLPDSLSLYRFLAPMIVNNLDNLFVVHGWVMLDAPHLTRLCSEALPALPARPGDADIASENFATSLRTSDATSIAWRHLDNLRDLRVARARCMRDAQCCTIHCNPPAILDPPRSSRAFAEIIGSMSYESHCKQFEACKICKISSAATTWFTVCKANEHPLQCLFQYLSAV
jgi:hypothetical protein